MSRTTLGGGEEIEAADQTREEFNYLLAAADISEHPHPPTPGILNSSNASTTSIQNI